MKLRLPIAAALCVCLSLSLTCTPDELARTFMCADVCDNLVNDCLSILSEELRAELESQCLTNCHEEATAEQLDCFDEHSCTDILLGACWGS